MLREFKEFALRGSVIDMAIGFTVGAAFTALVKSGVTNLLMPPLGLLLGDRGFRDNFWLMRAGDPPPPYDTVEAAEAAGAVIWKYGLFIDELIAFLIVAWAIFLVVRGVNRLERSRHEVPPDEPTTKACPWCQSDIAVEAVRCPFCTSDLDEAPAT